MLGDLTDGEAFACSNIDDFGRIVLAHEQERGLGQIVDVHEFAALRYPPPQHHP